MPEEETDFYKSYLIKPKIAKKTIIHFKIDYFF